MEVATRGSSRSMDPIKARVMETVLITGASEGIGYEFAKLFAKEGYNLVVVARNEAKLNRIAAELSEAHGISVKVIVKDLSKGDAPEEIYDELQREGIRIDVLVNNAGFNINGVFSETDLSRECEMLQVLIWAPTKLTKLFLRDMLEQDKGKILNVSSLVAFGPLPFESVYAAAKAYVLHFTEAIADELAGTNISMTALCPGATRTQFAIRSNVEDTLAFRYTAMNADVVAKAGYDALMSGKRRVVPGIQNKAMALSRRLSTTGLTMKIAKLFVK
jgi:uncharacterized protein